MFLPGAGSTAPCAQSCRNPASTQPAHPFHSGSAYPEGPANPFCVALIAQQQDASVLPCPSLGLSSCCSSSVNPVFLHLHHPSLPILLSLLPHMIPQPPLTSCWKVILIPFRLIAGYIISFGKLLAYSTPCPSSSSSFFRSSLALLISSTLAEMASKRPCRDLIPSVIR